MGRTVAILLVRPSPFSRLFISTLLFLAACNSGDRITETVDASQHKAFWLWAGVKPQPVLEQADEVYILDSELRALNGALGLTRLRAAVPKTGSTRIWLVVRIETLRWPDHVYDEVVDRLDQWKAAGNNLVGLQIDFDARTKHLDEYVRFLKVLRGHLPQKYRLSITGLMDWSAQGDPEAFRALSGIIDELVIQTYQGRQTISGYDQYLKHLSRIKMPYRIGLVQCGKWEEPENLKHDRNFRGYVVFLVNKAHSD
jgi:hypothetical protein